VFGGTFGKDSALHHGMDFRLLGPLEVLESDRPVSLGRGRQRALFALLLIHANEVVSTDRLIDELWGESPPRTALKSVQVYVSRLRKELGDGRLATRPPGYVLRTDPSEVDVCRFERLVGDADVVDPKIAAERLRSALELWRGPALGDMAFEPFARAEIARLDELHAAATEKRIEADLACGRHAELIGELESLVAQHPLWERLRSQLMLALYRSGRQADALSAYRNARRELSEGLGLEPGEELRALEQAILRHDPNLDLPGGAAPQRSREEPEQRADEAPEPPAGDPREQPATPARHSRVTPRRLLLAAGAVILAAAAAAGVMELTEESGSAEALAEVAPDSLAVLDPETNGIVGQISIPGQPSLVAAEGRSVWVASDTSRTIWRIDGRRLAVTKIVPANAFPRDLDATGDALWLFDWEPPGLVKVNLRYGSDTERVELGSRERPAGPGGAGVDAGLGGLWVADGSRRLLKLDPDDAAIVERFELPQRVDEIAVGPRSVWAISAASAAVLEIDPATGSVEARYEVTSRPGSTRPIPIAVAAGEDAIWVLNGNTPSVTRIDPELDAVTDTIPLGVGSIPTAIATGAGAVWVALSGDGSVARIDADSGELRTIPVGGAPTGVAVSLGKVWISVQPAFRSGLASRARTVAVPGAVSESFCSGVEFADRGTPQVLIVSDFPLQQGRGPFPTLQYSDVVRFVLARRGFRAGRYSVGYQSCDDSTVSGTGPYSWTPATCRRNARAYSGAPMVLGVVGPFDSPCAAFQIPILNRARGGPLADISGSTTAVGLTHRGAGSAPHEPRAYYPRGVRNFARVVAADDVQGAAAALMAKRLGVKRLFVLEDGMLYGSGIAALVRQTATRIGVGIAGTDSLNYRSRTFTPLAKRIKRSGADGVFFGGFFPPPPLAAPMRDLRTVLGRDVQFLAPDGFSDFEALVQGAGSAAQGMVISVASVPSARLPAKGRDFVEAFEHAISGRAEVYSPAVAQATEVLLDAIAASDGTRASVTRNLFRTRVENGILGDFEIDEKGDTTAGGVTMYRIEKGRPRVVDVITPPRSLVR
jgi:DNA-binding SARP family transcriptional activator/ABC-type branched-subunit amino acid transport system substrate-binding protein/DNA-binding beta-propeller fold protein YncE